MRAIRQHTFGPSENLRIETADDPVPDEGRVRIAVAAAHAALENRATVGKVVLLP